MKVNNNKEYNGKKYHKFYNLIYELKEGKGFIKEYENGYLIFEGEYLNGEKNGKGKEYNYQGVILFEGEYLNGKEYNGKRYDPDGNIIYELKKGMVMSNYMMSIVV